MNILIASIIDVKKSAPSRLHLIIRHLSKGHKITVICVNDWWKARAVNACAYYDGFDQIFDAIDIHYITDRDMEPFLQEILSPWLLRSESKADFDVLFNYDTLVSGYYLARKLNLPMVYDLADDLPEMIATSPQIPKVFRSFGRRFGEIMLRRNILASEKVTCTSKALQRRYLIPQNKFLLLPNGVDTSLFTGVSNSLKRRFGLDDFFVLGYVGVLREWVDLEPVYQAIKSFQNVKMLIVGEEGFMAKNQEMVERYGLEDKVSFTGTVPYNCVPEYIASMDLCLIPFRRNSVSQNAIPLKLFEYMACGKPVISSRLRGIMETVGDRILYADDADEYFAEIKHVMDNPSFGEFLGNNGREFVTRGYDWSRIVLALEALLLAPT